MKATEVTTVAQAVEFMQRYKNAGSDKLGFTVLHIRQVGRDERTGLEIGEVISHIYDLSEDEPLRWCFTAFPNGQFGAWVGDNGGPTKFYENPTRPGFGEVAAVNDEHEVAYFLVGTLAQILGLFARDSEESYQACTTGFCSPEDYLANS